jgi:6-oxocyclohex-1-ene-carbonyl-CoA hydrolase
MRLFNDMVTAILLCEKPVVCRVNGMRIAGGQEIGMAADYTIATDLSRFGQAGPKHGSAAIGGATDFLHLFVGIERAMNSLTLCEPWTAHQAYMYGLISDIVPALKVGGEFVPNPLVNTNRWIDDFGKVIYGTSKKGEELKQGKEIMASGVVDLSLLDNAVNILITKLLYTFPNCINKTITEVRKKKLEHWDKNKESSREWLALNMVTEARSGFRAFNEGTKENREVDFVKLRQMLAQGHEWSEELHRAISPQFRQTETA